MTLGLHFVPHGVGEGAPTKWGRGLPNLWQTYTWWEPPPYPTGFADAPPAGAPSPFAALRGTG